MRTLHLLNSLAGGGAERSTALLVADLRSRSIEADVIVLKRIDDDATAENERLITRAGGTIRMLSASTFRGRVPELRRILRAEDVDIVHTALYAADQVGRMAGLGLRTRVVSSWVSMPRTATEPGPIRGRRRRWMVNGTDALTCRLGADRLHAVSEGIATAYAAAYRMPRSRITVVERGRDIRSLGEPSSDRRARVRAALGVSDTCELIVSVGRLDTVKRHVDLVRAVGALEDRPELLCVIAGRDGTAANSVREEISRLALERRVRLLGHRDDVADLLAAADVMVLTSSAEGVAGVVIESMALGVPVVSTELQGMRGILVHQDTALLAPVGDTQALARSIRSVLDDPVLAQRLGERGRDEFAARFTQERSTDAMLEMYRQVLRG